MGEEFFVQILIYRDVRTRFARSFCPAFLKAEAQRLERKNGIFFLYTGNLLNIAKLRFCLQNVLVKAQASFVGVSLKLYKPTDYTHTMFSFVPLVAKEKASKGLAINNR